jgi:hypothetical protein
MCLENYIIFFGLYFVVTLRVIDCYCIFPFDDRFDVVNHTILFECLLSILTCNINCNDPNL